MLGFKATQRHMDIVALFLVLVVQFRKLHLKIVHLNILRTM